MAPRREMNRTSGVARRKAPSAQYNDSPFKGSDPFSSIASFVWRLPGAIASGRTLSGRKVTGEEVSGIAAMAALGAAGIYAGTRGVRGTRPASGPNAGRSGARPMTTAERSAAVTRAGRTGVGKIGGSTKPKGRTRDWEYDPEAGEMRLEPSRFDSSYDKVWRTAKAIQDNRNMRSNPRGTTVDQLVDVTGKRRYYDHTWDHEVFPEDAPSYISSWIPSYMKRTLDWGATRRPLRKTASVKPRTRR